MLSPGPQVCRSGEVSPAALESWAVDDPRWLRFLQSQPEATPFHHPAWSNVLTSSYGHRAFVLALRDADGNLIAGLPVLAMEGIRKRPRFWALPFTDHCPPLASSSVSLALFTDRLAHWQEADGVARIAVHGALAESAGVTLVTRAVRHVLPLSRSSDQVFESFRSSSVRTAIRKAQRQGLEARIGRSLEDLAPFYRLHLRTRRRLGVPAQPIRFMEALWKEMLAAGLGFLVLATYRDKPIAAALFLSWNRNLIYKFGASDPRYWNLRPNNLVIWTAIDWACRHGYRMLDFGRTDFDNQRLRDFKERWGSLELPLVYSYVGQPPSDPISTFGARALATVIRSCPLLVCQLMGEVFYQHMVPNVS